MNRRDAQDTTMVRKSGSKKPRKARGGGKKAGAGRKSGAPLPESAGRRPLLSRFLRTTFVIAIWGALALGAVIGWCAWTLPDLEKLNTPSRQPSITLMAADGSVLAAYGDLYGGKADFADIPPFLVQAIIATEDRRFFDHSGIDIIGILRAAWTNIRAGRIRQGGSTLTQQLAKNLFLTPERSLKRKIQEAMLAYWLEAKFSKEQLFTIYLNRVYLGSGTYGVSAAARRYFARPVTAINLRQASVIAGLLKAPTRYSPLRSRRAALQRGDQVLANMVVAEFLSAADAAAAKRQPLGLAPQAGAQVRYFADWVLDRAAGFVGRADRDLIVRTTLRPTLQSAAEKRMTAALNPRAQARGATQGALVTLDRDGAIRAMIGGRQYRASQFNRATQARRQPGSAFKLFVYLAALEAGASPGDAIEDKPVSIGTWAPRNYDGRFRGRVSLAEALSESLNAAAVRLSEKTGRRRVVAMAERLGITTPLKAHPSVALGASEVTLLELTSAFGVLANEGYAAWPYGILEISDSAGNLLYRRTGAAGRLLDPPVVRDMTAMLERVVASGTGRAARLPVRAAGKTGTSQDFRDAWFVGFARGMTTGVWIGNDAAKPMNKITGGSIPARLWRDYMRDAVTR